MRIASLNANKSCLTPRGSAAFGRWLAATTPSILLVQEPWRESATPPTNIGPLRHVAGSWRVAAFAANGAFEVTRVEERWVSLSCAGVTLHGVYLHDNSGAARADFLDRLARELAAAPGPHVVMGDFNLAPTDADGVFGDEPSKWTSARERTAFEALLGAANLVDATRDPSRPDRFTFERIVRGKPSRFRCDLALVDAAAFAKCEIAVQVDHSVRLGPRAFTDHSALLLDCTAAGHLHAGSTQPTLAAPATVAPTSTTNAATPANTAIQRSGPSAPARAFRRAYLTGGERVLDFGCGFGADVRWLRSLGFDVTGFDPGDRLPPEFRAEPQGEFDAVLAIYLVNVLPPPERVAALTHAWSSVRPGGLLFVAARPRSMMQDAVAKGWKPHADGYWSNETRGMFQKGFDRAELVALCSTLQGAHVEPGVSMPGDFTGVVVRKR